MIRSSHLGARGGWPDGLGAWVVAGDTSGHAELLEGGFAGLVVVSGLAAVHCGLSFNSGQSLYSLHVSGCGPRVAQGSTLRTTRVDMGGIWEELWERSVGFPSYRGMEGS